jgi:oligopeptide transport system substrate-binding protein
VAHGTQGWQDGRVTRHLAALTIATLALASCNQRSDAGPVIVSVIGEAPTLTDPARNPPTPPQRLVLASAAQGLVRFDAAGQVEPGIAERWTVIDRGMSYIFRLREGEWGDGGRITAEQVVTILKRQIAPGSRNALLPFLSAIDDVVEMTPEVIEIRLRRPRPDLLKLFAQPEMALFRTHPPGGGGPFRLAALRRDGALLRPARDPARSPDDEDAEKRGPQDDVELYGERAAKAIVRFSRRQSDLVTGGTIADWPLLAFADIAPANRRIDPAAGLFGLAIVNRTGFLADPANRAAIARAVDRQAIVNAFSAGWAATAQILPEALDSATQPAQAAWAGANPPGPAPADAVAAWQRAHSGTLRLRIALPRGPGGTILYGLIAANLIQIGIGAERVEINAPADLRLIDAVAPYDSARWYLATACQQCSAEAQTALEAAREADTMALRAQHLAEADAALAADVAFIPISRPLRWSLVSLRLKGWQGNSRAWHPLNHLRNDTN